MQFISWIVILGIVLVVSAQTPSFKVATPSAFTLYATSGQSSVYTVNVTLQDGSNAYNDPIYLIKLQGSRFQMGYDYGYMLGQMMYENYNTFMTNLLGSTWEDEALRLLLEDALDWQWNDYLSKQLPTQYMEELAGAAAGGHAAGTPANLDQIAGRMIALANAPGDPSDFILILVREYLERNKNADGTLYEAVLKLKQFLEGSDEPVMGLQCSMFGIWGSRSTDGSLLSARNLDWNKDTGIQKYKALVVYHSDDGAYPHATLGYIGLPGALTGMSSQGLTVHEANLEEAEITFDGFPWLLRLRYIMEYANNLTTAKKLWESTQNTVGFNHMVASANDVATGHAALAMETMFNYTAYFLDNDPREQNAVYVDPKTGEHYQIGYPLQEALWRTSQQKDCLLSSFDNIDHGYDPEIRKYFEWSLNPDTSTMRRYMYLHNGFVYYENAGIKMGEMEAINMTSIAGDKGVDHAYVCADNTDGSNVISATYHPSQQILYAAWENGSGSSWRPACCNTYVKFDMSKWW